MLVRRGDIIKAACYSSISVPENMSSLHLYLEFYAAIRVSHLGSNIHRDLPNPWSDNPRPTRVPQLRACGAPPVVGGCLGSRPDQNEHCWELLDSDDFRIITRHSQEDEGCR